MGGVGGVTEAAVFGPVDEGETADHHADETAENRNDHAAENGAGDGAPQGQPAGGAGAAAAADAPGGGEPFDDVHGSADSGHADYNGPAGELGGAGQDRGERGGGEHEPGAGDGEHGKQKAAEAEQDAGGPAEKDAAGGQPGEKQVEQVAHSLTPPAVRPEIRKRWQARKRRVMGSPERTAVAAKSPQR